MTDTTSRPELPAVPAKIDPADAPALTADLLSHRERLSAELDAAGQRHADRLAELEREFAAETETVASELSDVNAGLASVGRVLSSLAATATPKALRQSAGGSGARTLSAGDVASSAAALRDALAAHLADHPRTKFGAGELADAVGTVTGNRLTRALNALVDEGRAKREGTGPGTKYRHKG